MNARTIGFLKMSLAHHPLCYFYRHDVIRVPFFRSYPLCLGCTGVYSGMLFMLLDIFAGFFHPNWNLAIEVFFVCMIPTFIRFFITIPKKMKLLRFATRFLLGLAVGIGLFSLEIAPNVFLLILQLFIGILIYLLLARQRAKDPYPECIPCSFNPSKACPGSSIFYGLYAQLYGTNSNAFNLTMLKPKLKHE